MPLTWHLNKINNRPRKVLMFKKPKDLFYQKVIWKIALDGGMGVTQKRKDDAPKFPLNGEIDLMLYFKDNEKGGKHSQDDYYKRRVASEEDVKSLIWLTKMIIEK